jgi:hypothetical protein
VALPGLRRRVHLFAYLLIAKANMLAARGQRDGAVAILGSLALDPDSTLAAEHLAKWAPALLLGQP